MSGSALRADALPPPNTEIRVDGTDPGPPSGGSALTATGGLGVVDRFDRWVDDNVADRLRGNPVADRVFYGASALGDHGVIWLLIATGRGLRASVPLRATVRTASALGIESLVVNGPVKWLFRRQRPVRSTATPHPLRVPRTSSFPSGHATSAFCAAALLSDSDPSRWPVYFGLAAVVAWSRAHVRLHHASDVVGGAIIGMALGQAVKRLVPLPPAPNKRWHRA